MVSAFAELYSSFKGWMTRQFLAYQKQCVSKTYPSPVKVHTEQEI